MRCSNYVPELVRAQNNDTSSSPPSIKYRRSVVCAQLISGPENIQKCYNSSSTPTISVQLVSAVPASTKPIVAKRQIPSNSGLPKPLCISTCNAWVNSLLDIYNDQNACPNSANTDASQLSARLNSLCDQSFLNGSSDCISGDSNEINTCGFRTVNKWCSSCENSLNFQTECDSATFQDTLRFFNGNLFGNSTIIPVPKIPQGGDQSNRPRNVTVTSNKEPTPSDTTPEKKDDSQLQASLDELKSRERSLRSSLIATIVLMLLFLLALAFCLIHIFTKRGENSPEKSSWAKKFAESRFGFNPGIFSLKNTRTNNPKEKGAEKTPDFVDFFISNVGRPRQVISPFVAKREDEITLNPGDSIIVQIAFDDGWAVGKNVSTGKEGSFPMMCIIDSQAHLKKFSSQSEIFENIGLSAQPDSNTQYQQSKSTASGNKYDFSSDSSSSVSDASTEISNSNHVVDLDSFRISRKSSIKSGLETKRSSNTKSSMLSSTSIHPSSRYGGYTQLDDYPNNNPLIEIPQGIHISGRSNNPLIYYEDGTSSPSSGFVPTGHGRYSQSFNQNSPTNNRIILPKSPRAFRN
ncbi:hypothetical protein AYI68_g7930 [Smittium mucronatum]|uniref:SH3 domain-containing protein n=1 Tax=Smittium mucronatum TaxID=133383 RepID=A0A1R0GMD0_9FUNG|nr:hypothetical protein AYI68_g7930 [Smittium mucronatum]